jgi:sugar O-acyltransferase (sialic acid O-acetyltransferase NeuD family)
MTKQTLIPVRIPLLNPNETEALLVSLEVEEGQPVEKDQVLALIETTKSTGEVLAESGGYWVGLRFEVGDSLQAGDVLAYIGQSPDAQDPSLPPWAPEAPEVNDEQTEGLRITAPARALALEKGLNLEDLSHGPLITRERVMALVAEAKAQALPEIPEGENRLVIYGAGGHGRSLAALVRKTGGYELVGFIDDGVPAGEKALGLPILGGREKLAELAGEGIRLALNGVGGIGDLKTRLEVFDLLTRTGFHCPNVIHPTAFLEDSVGLGDGCQVMPLAYVGTQVETGFGCIINTGAIVSHDCQLESYVNLSPGATLAGGVTVGEGSLVGMRATVNLNVRIGRRALIGNGATVKADVPDGGVVPAGTIWPPRH